MAQEREVIAHHDGSGGIAPVLQPPGDADPRQRLEYRLDGCRALALERTGDVGRVEIKMSMTAPGCGMGDVLKADACRKVQGLAGVTDVDIEIVWEPAWDQSRMSEAVQLQLGLL